MKKGFTLIELLIVIAIIAVLSVVIILALNPAELLRQARDSNRISDMGTLRTAVALYLTDVATPNLGSAGTCYISIGTSTFSTVSSTGMWTFPGTTFCKDWFLTAGGTAASTTATTTRSIGIPTSTPSYPGSGWVPVDLANISSGAPLGQEPLDPINQAGNCNAASSSVSLSNCALFYGYIPGNTSFKLSAFMESRKFSNGGSGDVTTKDGGSNPYLLEVGTNLSL
ncbi:MAG: type II secretion system protein [Minisyncoccia bacterium]|jgi:prepilin-type N-terminal cleavage/methylation domain-containing protein